MSRFLKDAILAQEGKRVLLVDTDPQASMTISLGNPQPDNLPVTIADLMMKAMNDEPPVSGEGIIHHPERMDLLPSSIALAGTEVSLVNAMSRESILKYVLNDYRKDYDHILIDCIHCGQRCPVYYPQEKESKGGLICEKGYLCGHCDRSAVRHPAFRDGCRHGACHKF